MTDEVKAALTRIFDKYGCSVPFVQILIALASEDAVVEMLVLSIDKAMRKNLGPEFGDCGELTLTEKSMLVNAMRAALKTLAEKCR